MNHPIHDLIIELRMPEFTEEFIKLHETIQICHELGTLDDALLNRCQDPECIVCGRIICPYHEPLHFHHDRCPACLQ